MIAHNPLHGSGQADFPHPALALGNDAHAAQGIGMTDNRQRQSASDEAPHTIPEDATVLAAPRQRAVPEPPDLEPKNPQRVLVPRHTVNIGCAHAPPLATTCPVRGWVRACVAEARLSHRSTSSATFCESFGNDMRWELENLGGGTRLTLWTRSIAASSQRVLRGGTFVSTSWSGSSRVSRLDAWSASRP